jgi:uncharacterized membrane protein
MRAVSPVHAGGARPNTARMVERKRHLAKALTYRAVGSCATAAIAFAATGDAKVGASIGLIDSVAKIGCYYIHERLWYRIRWGVHPSPTEASTETRRYTPRRPTPVHAGE